MRAFVLSGCEHDGGLHKCAVDRVWRGLVIYAVTSILKPFMKIGDYNCANN